MCFCNSRCLLEPFAPASRASSAQSPFWMNFDCHVGFMMGLTHKRELRMLRYWDCYLKHRTNRPPSLCRWPHQLYCSVKCSLRGCHHLQLPGRKMSASLVRSDSLSCLSFLFKTLFKNLNFVNYFVLGIFVFFFSDQLGCNFFSPHFKF